MKERKELPSERKREGKKKSVLSLLSSNFIKKKKKTLPNKKTKVVKKKKILSELGVKNLH